MSPELINRGSRIDWLVACQEYTNSNSIHIKCKNAILNLSLENNDGDKCKCKCSISQIYKMIFLGHKIDERMIKPTLWINDVIYKFPGSSITMTSTFIDFYA